MEPCKGLNDWLSCLRCPYLCTKMCPIEGEDVMEEMKRQMRLAKVDLESEGHIKGHIK